MKLFLFISDLCLASQFQILQRKLFNDAHRDLQLLPVTSKIEKAHLLTLVNMSAKFDEVAHIALVSIMFISLLPYMSIVTLTFDLQNQ